MLVDLVVGVLQRRARFAVDATYRVFQRMHSFQQITRLRIEIKLALGRLRQLFERSQIHRAELRNFTFHTQYGALQLCGARRFFQRTGEPFQIHF